MFLNMSDPILSSTKGISATALLCMSKVQGPGPGFGSSRFYHQVKKIFIIKGKAFIEVNKTLKKA